MTQSLTPSTKRQLLSIMGTLPSDADALVAVLGVLPLTRLDRRAIAVAARQPLTEVDQAVNALLTAKLLEPVPNTDLLRVPKHVHEHATTLAARLREGERREAWSRWARHLLDAAITAGSALSSRAPLTPACDAPDGVGWPFPAGDAAAAVAWLVERRTDLVTAVRAADTAGRHELEYQLVGALIVLAERHHLPEWPGLLTHYGVPAAELHGDIVATSRLLCALAEAHRRTGDHQKAEDHARQALANTSAGLPSGGPPSAAARPAGGNSTNAPADTFTDTTKPIVLADIESRLTLASVHRSARRTHQAVPIAAQALALADEAGDRRSMALARIVRAEIAFDDGRPDEAINELRQAIPLLQHTPDQFEEARAVALLGQAIATTGDHRTAVMYLGEAHDRYVRAGSPLGEVQCLQWLGDIIGGARGAELWAEADNVRWAAGIPRRATQHLASSGGT
ncbi:tetratricopeptide repeat protein [Streptomyces millisiae]|uniref:Tetratricopeptide repeat protein n=1 Tax=Streptomyces millisiae TaxID=3075542 RepID=A0ABU2LW97_9ACTN|nr:hypothetical protein [Streptomyces sp. DSM 44918]MDT0321870.1 hypothetical protein [Streptomyces sp. DSM 44918]